MLSVSKGGPAVEALAAAHGLADAVGGVEDAEAAVHGGRVRHPRGREPVMVPKSRPRIGRSMAAYACLGIITRRRPGGSGSASSGAMGRRRARSSASLGTEPVGELGAGAELGGGAVSLARSCTAEARRQQLSELGRDGSAARSLVGELGRRTRRRARGGDGRRGGELGAAVTIEEGNVQDNDMWAFIYCS